LTTLERLQAILHKDFDIDPQALQPDTPLETLDIDSLKMIEILFCVEDEFGISIPPEQAKPNEALHTVADLVAFVDTLAAGQRDAKAGTPAGKPLS
jgi:acyl carrier protein